MFNNVILKQCITCAVTDIIILMAKYYSKSIFKIGSIAKVVVSGLPIVAAIDPRVERVAYVAQKVSFACSV